MGGEYSWIAFWAGLPWELPPRARRIPGHHAGKYPASGTTSACAENTVYQPRYLGFSGNYLRVRGEYTPRASARCLRSELPPRARRIRLTTSFTGLNAGTTSACAENTHPAAASRRLAWNYLRMRGEYLKTGEIAKGDLELPPRARRIQQRRSMGHPQMGTTSTCAENTSVLVDLALEIGNYLRVRGEYIQAFRHGCGNEELPPRARRILL